MAKGGLHSKSHLAGRTDQVCKEAVAIAREIYSSAMALSKPDLSQVDLGRGFEVSKTATEQATDVPMTPIMKNIIESFDPSLKKGWRLTIDDEPTKGEKWVDEQIRKRLVSFNGPENLTYNESDPLDSISHYNIDCWQNYKDNLRQVQPGQEKERREVSKMFQIKADPEPIFRILENDRVMQKAFMVLFDAYPSVTAELEFKESSAPFETKHTNVGFKWWQNDRNIEPKSGLTYGQLCRKTAEALNDKNVFDYNINTYYGRNQRGKGRLITATSRVANLYLNRIESREIEALKKVSYFQGYGDDECLKRALMDVLNLCNKKKLLCRNFDQKKFDVHINPAWLAIVGALRVMKAKGALGKRLCRIRAMMNIHSWVVNGMSGEVEEIYGRMFSGFIDTNQGDGLVEILIFLYCLMKLDKDYLNTIEILNQVFMLVMGDDCLAVYNKDRFNFDEFIALMATLGFEIHKDKGEFGVFFLQYRLFKYKDKLVMAYPWTRVLRSMLFTEKTKGLGPYGWLMAQYQQLSKLEECSEALDSVVSIIFKYDKLKLGADLTVDQILEGVRAEDREAQKTTADHRYSSTAEKLYDGDPTKTEQFTELNGKLEFNPTYLHRIHEAVKGSVARCRTLK